MLVRAEPLAHMPPWCLLLAAAAGTDRCTPRWGLHPKTPNVMLPFAERLMCMPPWCPLLAAAVGTDISARLACAWKRAAHLLPAFFAGRGLGGTGTGSPNRGRGGDAPRKKETYLHNNVSCSGRKAAGATAAPAPRAGTGAPDPQCDAAACETSGAHAAVVPTAGCCRGN